MISDQALLVTLTIQKNGNIYTFNMPMGAPHGEIYDVLFAMLNDVLELSKLAADKAAPAPVKE